MKHSVRAVAALAALLGIVGTTRVAALEWAGAYLAGRAASAENDFSAAVRYLSQALDGDPSNPVLMENLVIGYVGLGLMNDAVPIAGRLAASAPNSRVGKWVITAASLADPDIALPAGEGVHDNLTNRLLSAWTTVEEGRMAEALGQFDEVIATQGLRDFGLYHKALALSLVGDFESAERIFSGNAEGSFNRTRRGVFVHAVVLSQLGRRDDAIELIRGVAYGGDDARLRRALEVLKAGEVLSLDFIQNTRDGQAEVFHSLALMLSRGEVTDGRYSLLYSRLAEHLRPGNIDSVLVSAELLGDMGRYDLAIETYEGVASEDPLFHVAETGRAEALYWAGEVDAAVDDLARLGENHPAVADIHMTLGDLLRREKRFPEATRAYDRTIDIRLAENVETWLVYYARGITLERSDEWDRAETDFRRALDLNPDQPDVLNYLGYSLVEMGQKLDEALGMIERAAAGAENNGYITDSLGWVLYRLGRYGDAVAPMERAVELVPSDPVINDHLGDVLWKVGRKREARFQWLRALDFDPEPKDEVRIRRKLAAGLDVVLEEETAFGRGGGNDG